MPFQHRFSSPVRLLLAPLGALLVFSVCSGWLFSTTTVAQRVQSSQVAQNPISKLGQAFRARVTSAPAIETQNFIVYANDEQLARKVSKEAERFRKELSIQWLGREIPTWRHKCPINVQVRANAGGETSFAFITDNLGRGAPIDWNMKIYGPPNRLLDAVLPHEITHTIFATHFGCPLPRWADEGACTTVEHESERRKNHRMLLEFLTAQPSRGIPFNRMFTMRNYPHDILPLYAQGYSLARFLIAKKGRRHFVDYVERGLENESRIHQLRAWDDATHEFYQYRDLSELQVDWLAWVKDGSSESQPGQALDLSDQMAKSQPKFRSSVYLNPDRQAGVVVSASFVELASSDNQEMAGLQDDLLQRDGAPHFNSKVSGSWYVREMNRDELKTQTSTEASAYEDRFASKSSLPKTNQLRKVPAIAEPPVDPPAAHDARLPRSFQNPTTVWR